MSKGPQKIRGTQDIWGEAADRFDAVVKAFDKTRRLFAFQRIELQCSPDAASMKTRVGQQISSPRVRRQEGSLFWGSARANQVRAQEIRALQPAEGQGPALGALSTKEVK